MDSSKTKMKVYTSSKQIDIIYENLTYSIRSYNTNGGRNFILKNISGHFKSGELTGILGPSGAGKTTLLNILTGFQHEGNIEGNIKIVNGSKDSEENYFDCGDVCYIPQDDYISPFFTVDETMTIAAELKLADTIPQNTKQEIIGSILELNRLTKIKDTLCGKLSFGERKRLAIALELINNPSVMFLDKPTTGLDSLSSHQYVTTLKNLAKSGRTIVCTIHQPSARVFELFDHIYVLAAGTCIYQGRPSDVISVLQTIKLECPQFYNPADFVIEVANGEYGHFNSQLSAIANKPVQPSYTVDLSGASTSASNDKHITCDFDVIDDHERFNELNKGPTEFRRFKVLSKKYALKLYRDWTSFCLKIGLHTLTATLIGLMFANYGGNPNETITNTKFLAISLIYLSYTSMMPAIWKFSTELNAFKKEYFNHWYKLSTFYCAYIVVNVAMQVLFTMIYVALSYHFSSQLPSMMILINFFLICLLINLASEGFGLWLGVNITSVSGLFLGAVFSIIFLLFAGYFVRFSHTSGVFYYLSYCSYLKYAFDAMLYVTYYDYIIKVTSSVSSSQIYRKLASANILYTLPKEVINEFHVDGDGYFRELLMLFCFMILLYQVNFFSLRRKIRNLRVKYENSIFEEFIWDRFFG